MRAEADIILPDECSSSRHAVERAAPLGTEASSGPACYRTRQGELVCRRDCLGLDS